MIRRTFLAGATASAATFAAGTTARAQRFNRNQAVLIDGINRYINSITTMQGGFVQQSADGRVAEGLFFMRRPGRLRFEYFDPFPTTVIADGTWAAIQNRDLNKTDRLPLRSTPLFILLRRNVDLGRDNAVQSVERQAGAARVRVIDPDKPSDGSITMVFSTQPVELQQWIITDPQGRSSVIRLTDVRQGMRIDPNKFLIEENVRRQFQTNDR